MGFIWDWLKITVTLLTVLGLVLEEYIDVVFASVILVLYVIFRGAVRGSNGITKAVFWVFEIIFIFSLCVNVLLKGGGIVTLIPLIIEVFGTAVAWIVEMVLVGDITLSHGFLFVVAIIFLENIGIKMGNIRVHRAALRTFLIGVPIAMFIVFSNRYGGANALVLAAQILPILISLGGLYIMMFGWSSSRRKR